MTVICKVRVDLTPGHVSGMRGVGLPELVLLPLRVLFGHVRIVARRLKANWRIHVIMALLGTAVCLDALHEVITRAARGGARGVALTRHITLTRVAVIWLITPHGTLRIPLCQCLRAGFEGRLAAESPALVSASEELRTSFVAAVVAFYVARII